MGSVSGDDTSRGGDRGVEGGHLTDLSLLTMSVIWGVNFSVIKIALQELHPLAFNALRFPLAAATLYLLVRLRTGTSVPIRRQDLPLIVGLGILGNVAYQFLFIYGIDATLAGNAAILLAVTPVWTILLSTLVGEERLPPSTWLGALATVAGMVLVVVGGRRQVELGSSTLQGDLMMVGASFIWAVYTVGGRNLIRRYGPLRLTAWTLWVGTVGLVAVGAPFLVRTHLEELSPAAWAGVGYAGILAIGVAYLIWYTGVRRLGSSRTAVYSNLVPIVGLLVAWLWLGEEPSALQGLGAAVVIAGITAARLTGAPASPPPDPAPE